MALHKANFFSLFACGGASKVEASSDFSSSVDPLLWVQKKPPYDDQPSDVGTSVLRLVSFNAICICFCLRTKCEQRLLIRIPTNVDNSAGSWLFRRDDLARHVFAIDRFHWHCLIRTATIPLKPNTKYRSNRLRSPYLFHYVVIEINRLSLGNRYWLPALSNNNACCVVCSCCLHTCWHFDEKALYGRRWICIKRLYGPVCFWLSHDVIDQTSISICLKLVIR